MKVDRDNEDGRVRVLDVDWIYCSSKFFSCGFDGEIEAAYELI